MDMNFQFKKPDRYAEPIPAGRQKKWDKIINTFMENQFDELIQIHRTGTRGRIFSFLIKNMLDILQIPHDSEPIFDHIVPNKWYLDFASKHDLKIRTHDFYNPDYLLPDGTWLEITLSENTAYQKLFRYGHQAPALKVLWLEKFFNDGGPTFLSQKQNSAIGVEMDKLTINKAMLTGIFNKSYELGDVDDF